MGIRGKNQAEAKGSSMNKTSQRMRVRALEMAAPGPIPKRNFIEEFYTGLRPIKSDTGSMEVFLLG